MSYWAKLATGNRAAAAAEPEPDDMQAYDSESAHYATDLFHNQELDGWLYRTAEHSRGGRG